ncbi:MAG: serine hydrolase [Planctomycetes bacterium]|nr:serine hydrolase [Planctomycetota bacterium]
MKTLVAIAISLVVASAAPAQDGLELEPALARRRALLDEAAALSMEHGGLSFLVQHRGEVVHERYAARRDADDAWFLASGTKSFCGVAAVCMVEDGLLESLDERVADTITEWQDDARKSRITVRQLLSLVSGIDTAAGELDGPKYDDKYAVALQRPTFAEPGAKFRYGPAPFYVFGELMFRKLRPADGSAGENPLQYMRRRFLDPIGIRIADWRHDRAGHPQLPSGAKLTAREWAKFGEFIRDRGRVGERQIVDAQRLDECFVPTDANRRYGLTFWLPRAGVVQAAGAGGQRLVIVRDHDLVIVRQATENLGRDEQRVLDLVLEAFGVDLPDFGDPTLERGSGLGSLFDRADTNGDDKLTADELPESRGPRMRRLLQKLDLDGDGAWTREELAPLRDLLLIPQDPVDDEDAPQAPPTDPPAESPAGPHELPGTGGSREM